MTIKLPYHLLMLKKRELNYKTTFVIKKVIYWFPVKIYSKK